MGKSSMPPGFRFHPTHVELIMFYLKRKVMQKKLPAGVISELDIYRHAPWDLPDQSCLKSRDLKWYFFCPRERKYASGARMNRATESGYWKSTGKDRRVNYNNDVVGQIKTLTFYIGKPPKGKQTDWVMHEYRIEEKDLSEEKDSYVLCVIFQKDGPGPRNGAQYGAPFNEEEWDTDDVEVVDSSSLEVDPSAGPSVPSVLPPNKEPHTSFLPDISAPQSNLFGHSSESYVSEILPSSSKEIPQIAGGDIDSMIIPQILDNCDDIFSIQEFFPEDENLDNGDGNQKAQNEIHGTVAASNNPDRNDIYKDLEDLGCSAIFNERECGNIDGQEALYISDQMLSTNGAMHNSDQILPSNKLMYSSDQIPFLELNDLEAPLSCTTEGTKYKGFQTSNLTWHCPNTIEQPYSLSIPFGTGTQQFSSFQYHLPHKSNDQVYYSTESGFPEQHISASGQSSLQDSAGHHNSNEGCSSSYKAPWT